jgi:hypothetical protein
LLWADAVSLTRLFFCQSTATFDNFSDPLEFNSFHIGGSFCCVADFFNFILFNLCGIDHIFADAVAIPESAIEAMKAWAEDRGYSPTMDQMKTLAKNTNINLEQVREVRFVFPRLPQCVLMGHFATGKTVV